MTTSRQSVDSSECFGVPVDKTLLHYSLQVGLADGEQRDRLDLVDVFVLISFPLFCVVSLVYLFANTTHAHAQLQ